MQRVELAQESAELPMLQAELAQQSAELPVLLEQMPKEPPEQKPRGQWNPQQVQPECWPKPKAELLPAGAYP